MFYGCMERYVKYGILIVCKMKEISQKGVYSIKPYVVNGFEKSQLKIITFLQD